MRTAVNPKAKKIDTGVSEFNKSNQRISCQNPHVLKSCNIENKSKPPLNFGTLAAGILVLFPVRWSLTKEIQAKKDVRSLLWEKGEILGPSKEQANLDLT